MHTSWMVEHALIVAKHLGDGAAIIKFSQMDKNPENDTSYNEACNYLDNNKVTVWELSTDPTTGYHRSW